MGDRRKLARALAAEALAAGAATAWFERLYARAEGEPAAIPWADMRVNPSLQAWLERERPRGEGRRALKVGCGLGDDAEALAACGFRVTAFDISPTAIAWCRRRFPLSAVEYAAADLFHAPAEWGRAFDLVVEAYTLQVLPPELRGAAAARIARFVQPGGTLLVITRGREPEEDPGAMPWPLTRAELDSFPAAGLREAVFEDYLDAETPPVRRFRSEYRA